jgi:hypothetical protein
MDKQQRKSPTPGGSGLSEEIQMIKFPLFLNGALVDNGRAMPKAEAAKLVRAAYGESAKAVKTQGVVDGKVRTEWRAIR